MVGEVGFLRRQAGDQGVHLHVVGAEGGDAHGRDQIRGQAAQSFGREGGGGGRRRRVVGVVVFQVEMGGDHRHQILGDHRFAHEVVGAGGHYRFAILVKGAGAEGHHLDAVPVRILAQAARRLVAVHAGHDDVHEDEVGAPSPPGIEGFDAVARLSQDEAHRLQHPQQQQPVVGLVVHHQDAHLALAGAQPRHPLPGRARRQLGIPAFTDRNIEPEQAALARNAGDGDIAAHQAGEAAADGEAEAGAALGHPVRRLLEGLEEQAHLVGGDAGAGVFHLDGEVGRGLARHRPAPHHHAAPFGELDGVAGKVDQYLPELALVADDVSGQAGGKGQFPVQTLGVGRHPEHQVEVVEQGVEVERVGPAVAASGFDLRHFQHVVDEGEQVLAAAHDHFEILAVACRQSGALAQNPAEAQNGVHGRADLVAHVGEEGGFGMAGRLSFLLGLAELPVGFGKGGGALDHQRLQMVAVAGDLLFGAAAFGDVEEHGAAHHEPPRLVAHSGGAEGNRHRGPVFAQHVELEIADGAGDDETPEMPGEALLAGGREQVGKAPLAHQLLAPVAEPGEFRLIDLDEGPGFIKGVIAAGGVIVEVLDHRCRFGQCLLGLEAFDGELGLAQPLLFGRKGVGADQRLLEDLHRRCHVADLVVSLQRRDGHGPFAFGEALHGLAHRR